MWAKAPPLAHSPEMQLTSRWMDGWTDGRMDGWMDYIIRSNKNSVQIGIADQESTALSSAESHASPWNLEFRRSAHGLQMTISPSIPKSQNLLYKSAMFHIQCILVSSCMMEVRKIILISQKSAGNLPRHQPGTLPTARPGVAPVSGPWVGTRPARIAGKRSHVARGKHL